MSENWLKMRNNLQSHPKVVRMASALKADTFRIIGGLHAVWCLFDEHSVDGSLDGYDEKTIDRLSGFPGISKAMIAVDWLTVEDGSSSLPEFDSHNGQSAKRRALEAKRKQAERAQTVQNPSASEADKKSTREDKRRIDKKEKIEERASRLPKDFAMPDEWMDWARTERPDVDANSAFEQFRDYWAAKPGRDGLKLDWQATWRNWVRNQRAKGGSAAGEPAWRTEQRERMQKAAPYAVAKGNQSTFIDEQDNGYVTRLPPSAL